MRTCGSNAVATVGCKVIDQTIMAADKPIRVHYFLRPQFAERYSIERVFAAVQTAMPPRVECREVRSRLAGRGVLSRIWHVVAAAAHQGDINHITGDVHYVTILLRKRRTVLTMHDLGHLNTLKGLRRSLFKLFWFSLPCRRSAIITTISEFTRGQLLAEVRIDPRRVRVVHDPVPAGFVHAPKPFDADCPSLLHVGGGEWKNLARELEALQGIRCRLRVIGKISDANRQRIERFGIDCTSIRDLTDADVIEEYRRCDVVLFASTYEGFGMPIIEGQATGRPVITGNITAMPEVAGDTACQVDPYDVTSIRRGVLRVLNDAEYRGTLIERGLENVKRFAPQRIAADYLKLYEEVLRYA